MLYSTSNESEVIMMNKKASFVRKFGGAGLAGALVFASAGVTAATFDASADVQNALDVTQVQPMSFGTLFAVRAVSGDADRYSFITLQPEGGFDDTLAHEGETAGGDSIPLISLGGSQPAIGSVAVGSTATFQLTLPDGVSAGVAGDPETDVVGLSGTVPVLRIGGAGGDPAVARFSLTNFTLGNLTGGTAAAPTGSVFPVTPSFGSTEVQFGIGATIITDTSGSRTTYEAGTYSGTFEVTASY